MFKRFFVILIASIFYTSLSTSTILAGTKVGGDECDRSVTPSECVDGYSCQKNPKIQPFRFVKEPNLGLCEEDNVGTVFGKITPPDALKTFIGNDPSGERGISKLLGNIIALFYSLAGVVLIFMIVWGAFDWITSEGDKEKLASAQKKILNALIGILLFAVAFAVIQVFGQFTGFKFFEGQK